jgi:hypothetical protein
MFKLKTVLTQTQLNNHIITLSVRGIARIPHWDYHIRFDPKFGRKRPCQDVLDRFKRLNNGKHAISSTLMRVF